MAQYEVLRDCYGFKSRYWEKGEIVEINPREKPPIHFKLLSTESEPAPEKKATSENLKSYLRPQQVTVDKQSKKRGLKGKLTEKQKNFIKAFLKKLSGTKAVVEAYPEVKNRNTAGVMAHELLRNPKIKKIIDEQFDEGRGNCGSDFVDFEITE